MEKPINIRISDQTAAKLDAAIAQTGKPKADLMRQSLEIGLSWLESIGYDLEKFAIDRLMSEVTPPKKSDA